jgi:hypothetical protein
MKIRYKIAATTVAIMCTLVFSSVPTLAADTGAINLGFNTAQSAPQIKTITPTATSLTCTPDGTTLLHFTVIGFSSGGWQQLARLEAQVMKGAVNAGPVITVAAGTQSGAKEATYAVDAVFQYYWMHGSDYTVKFTLYNTNAQTDTQSSVALTYQPAAGLAVEGAAIDFATLNYSQTSSTATSAVHNSANTPINIGATASAWQSDVGWASVVPVSSLWGSSTTNPTPQQMSPIATLATSGVGTLSGGTGGAGTPPAAVTTSWYVVVPAASDTFVLVGNYTTSASLTATSTG